ncbi:hypothetical protein ACFVMC_28450 [Nocardia sp. NPDC127579]|uniref:hypothetical protein n=1 Tax=Nocardia sp. NPDC127579 TaxID=3345402 RepID=UPI0036250B4E
MSELRPGGDSNGIEDTKENRPDAGQNQTEVDDNRVDAQPRETSNERMSKFDQMPGGRAEADEPGYAKANDKETDAETGSPEPLSADNASDSSSGDGDGN